MVNAIDNQYNWWKPNNPHIHNGLLANHVVDVTTTNVIKLSNKMKKTPPVLPIDILKYKNRIIREIHVVNGMLSFNLKFCIHLYI